MPLAALIAAQEADDSGQGLRATLPVAGRTLIEYQAALAARAGADMIVILVERMPGELARAVQRLRNEGAAVVVARTIADAVDRFDPDTRILLIADGCVAGDAAVERLAQADSPALMVVPDKPEHAMLERLDAEERWAGFALIDGARLHATHAMLGDWDLVSTVLRRAAQEDAERVEGDGAGEIVPLIAVEPKALAPVERALMARGRRDGSGWVARYIHRLIVAPIASPLAARGVKPMPIAIGSVAAAWLAPLLGAFGFFWPAAVLLPIATSAFAVARAVGTIWAPELPARRLLIAARHAAALAVLALLALMLVKTLGWGWALVALAIPAGLAGLDRARPIEAALAAGERPVWLASGDALIWLLPPLAVLAGWPWTVATLALYALGSFVARFDALARRAAPRLAAS